MNQPHTYVSIYLTEDDQADIAYLIAYYQRKETRPISLSQIERIARQEHVAKLKKMEREQQS